VEISKKKKKVIIGLEQSSESENKEEKQKTSLSMRPVPSLRIVPPVPLVVSLHVDAAIRACMVSYPPPLSPFYVPGPADNILPAWHGLHVVLGSVGIA
jgi:hypothetical protein